MKANDRTSDTKISESLPRRRKHVFVVDDEPVIAATLSQILRVHGFEVISFTNPIDALEAAFLSAPDVVISDVIMPLLSGIELAIRVSESSPDCRVILFSGQMGTSDMLIEAKEQGYRFEIVAKPVHPLEILRRIEAPVQYD